jgi:hypothetical protein
VKFVAPAHGQPEHFLARHFNQKNKKRRAARAVQGEGEMLRSICMGLAFATAGLLLSSCGGGGGGGGGGGASTPGAAPAPAPAAGIALTANLQQGSFSEFAVNTETTSFAQGSSPSSTTDFGIFRLTLGAPTTISGETLYPVVATGKTTVGGTSYRPRWTHLGIRNGSVMGSADGVTVQTIYDASSATAASRGFFITFGASENVTPSSATFTGEYNTLPAVRASHASSSGGCETILGLTLCSDSSTSFSEQEYYKDGVGPIGYTRNISFSSNGGGFFSSTQIKHTIEIVGTSLTPSDGATIKPAPWEELAPMAIARKNVSASVFNGEIYVFGGLDSANNSLSSVEIYDPLANSWRSGVAAPVGLGSYKAATVGTKSYLVNSSSAVRVFDHGTNAWSTGPVAPFTDPSFDLDVWTDPNTGHTHVMVISSRLNTAFDVFFYDTTATPNVWLQGASVATIDHRWHTMRVLGNAVYLTGGFRQGPGTAFNGTYRYNILAANWTTSGLGTLQVARYNHRAVTLDGVMHILGGNKVDFTVLRDVEAYDTASAGWSARPRMLRPRLDHAAVVLGGRIYVIGGRTGTSTGTAVAHLDAYTP